MDYSGAWKTAFPDGFFDQPTNVIISFFPRNSKIYQITLKFEALGDMLFSPCWQRFSSKSNIIKLRWIEDFISAEIFYDESSDNLCCKWSYNGGSVSTKLVRCDAFERINKHALILENIGRYALLKKYSKYSCLYANNQSLSFTYSDKSSKKLQKLSEYLELERLVSYNDFTTMKNIMKLVNTHLIHNGFQQFGVNRDAMSILTQQNGMASCRGLAIVLCEALLSVNIASRFIACWPYEHPYEECHVICIAYSRQLNKWILLDPTNNLYMENHNGVPMDIAEFREALLSNQLFHINDDTNWNGSKVSKNQYCNYMIKNMICFDSHVNLFSNCDRYSNYIATLIPDNYDITITDRILINNDYCFWSKPLL